MKLFIPLILGTAREGRHTEHAARFIYEEILKLSDVDTEFLDVRDFRILATDKTEHTALEQKFSALITRADGLIIVTPEYNHGYPGELKMMLDMAYDEYAKKPIALVGTGGGMGGARAIEQLRSVVIELSAIPIQEAIYFPNVYHLFDESGALKDPAPYRERIRAMCDQLLWYARVLKKGREIGV